MNEGTHCPDCGKVVGFWPVFRAAWPTRIICPSCRSRLSYAISVKKTVWCMILPACVVLLALSFGAAFWLVGSICPVSLALALLFWVVLWSTFEVINTIYWRRTKRLFVTRNGSGS